jgi:hypothetical protein
MVTRADLDKVGYLRDARNRLSNIRTYARDIIVSTRDFIYRLGYGVKSAAVERVLQAKSLTPTLVSGGASLFETGIPSHRHTEHVRRETQSI